MGESPPPLFILRTVTFTFHDNCSVKPAFVLHEIVKNCAMRKSTLQTGSRGKGSATPRPALVIPGRQKDEGIGKREGSGK